MTEDSDSILIWLYRRTCHITGGAKSESGLDSWAEHARTSAAMGSARCHRIHIVLPSIQDLKSNPI